MDVRMLLRVPLLLSFAVLGHCDGASDIELQLESLGRRIDFVHRDSLRLEGTIKSLLEARFQSIEAELQGRYLSQDNAGRGGSSVENDGLRFSEKVSQKLAPFYKAFEEEKGLRKILSVDTKTNVDTLNATCKDFHDQTLAELVEVANNSSMTDEVITNDVQNLSDEMDSKFNQLERSVQDLQRNDGNLSDEMDNKFNKLERSVQDLQKNIMTHVENVVEHTDRKINQLENTMTDLLQNLQQSFSGLMENITHIHAGYETILQSIPPVNHALGIPREQLSGDNYHRLVERIVDGDNSTCAYTPSPRYSQPLYINLGHRVIIARIVIIGYIYDFIPSTSINVTVTVSRMDSNSPQQVCGQSKIQHFRNTSTPFNIILICEAPLIGSSVHVSMYSAVRFHSRMCEVEVYSTT